MQGGRRKRKPTLQTTPERSRLMGRVRQSGTAGEIAVRKALRTLGIRYRVNVRGLPGSPDLANQRKRFAIFVHGCYWHRHVGCVRTTTPTRNREFWVQKFSANEQRDAKNKAALEERGFTVCVIWECESLDQAKLIKRLQTCLKSNSVKP